MEQRITKIKEGFLKVEYVGERIDLDLPSSLQPKDRIKKIDSMISSLKREIRKLERERDRLQSS